MSKGRVIKNYIYDLSYQIIVTITPLITTPYIARVLGATNIGINNYVGSIVAYFVLLGSLGTTLYGRREIAYFQDDPERRTAVFWEIFSIRLLLSSISLFIYLICFFNSARYTIIFRIFTIEVLANAFDISWFFQGLEDFKKTVTRNVILRVVSISLIFTFVKTENDLPLYTICTVLPSLFGHLAVWPFLNGRIVRRLRKPDIKKHILPILTLFIPQIAIEIYTALDKTMIGALCADIAQVAYYAEAQKIIKTALKFVTSIAVVMMPNMAHDYSEGNKDGVNNSVYNSFRFISLVGIPVMFGIVPISDSFVPLFYGDGYEDVKILLKITSVLIIIISYSTVIGSQYLLATKQHKIYTGSVIAGACINAMGNVLLIPGMGALGASIASIIAEFCVSFIQVLCVKKDIPMLKYTMMNWKYYLAGIVMMFVVLLSRNYFVEGIASTIVQIATGGMVYFVLVLLLRDEMVQVGINIFKGKIFNGKK